MIKKPILLFTNFLDAEQILKNGFVFLKYKNKFAKIDFKNKPVYSVSLLTPKNIKSITLDCFCPHYSIYERYKEDKNWDKFKSAYINQLKSKKIEIKKWIKNKLSLQPIMGDVGTSNKIDLFCSWDLGTKCHRKIVFDLLSSSRLIRERSHLIYREGKFTTKDLKKNETTDYKTKEALSKLKDSFFNDDSNIKSYSLSVSPDYISDELVHASNYSLEVLPLHHGISYANAKYPPYNGVKTITPSIETKVNFNVDSISGELMDEFIKGEDYTLFDNGSVILNGNWITK